MHFEHDMKPCPPRHADGSDEPGTEDWYALRARLAAATETWRAMKNRGEDAAVDFSGSFAPRTARRLVGAPHAGEDVNLSASKSGKRASAILSDVAGPSSTGDRGKT